MAPRITYANLAQGYAPFLDFDQSFSDVGLLGNIPCTCVTTTNVIRLTPVVAAGTPAASAYPPNITGYQNYIKFAFVADATSTGTVTATIVAPAGSTANSTLSVYKGSGVQVTTGDVVLGTYYELVFAAALNSGNGGFYLLSPLFGAAVLAPVANNTVLGNNSGGLAAPSAISASAVLDMVGNTSGSVVIRGAATWAAAVPSGDVTITTAGVTAIGANKVTSAMIRQGVARSVIGVTGNATANVADIAGTANQVLVVNSAGTALAFGQVNLAAAAAVTGTLPSTLGGTDNAVYAIGDLIQASATTTLARLAAVATGNVLLSGGVTAVSAWGKVGLTTHVSGQLPLANGGTAANLTASNGGIFYSTGSAGAILAGTATASLPLLSGATAAPTWAAISYPTSATSGGVPYFSSTSVMASSAILNLNQLLIGGGAGNPPTTLGTTGLSTTVLHGSATAPTFSQIVAADVTTNTLTNATLAQIAANSFKGNPTTSLANAADFTIGSLTLKGSPVGADLIIIADSAASFGLKQVALSTIPSASGISSLNGQTGALILKNPAGGRLTLTTATPVLTTSVSGATTVYYTPYIYDQILLYDGTNFIPTTFTELSQATTDATKSPAAVAANKNYDVFVWNDSGTIRATRGPAWTSDTARGSGAGTTQLSVVNGLTLNTVSITNGPAASRGTYVGSIRSNGSSQIDYIFGASAAGGTAGSFGVWNNYNRISVQSTVTDSTASWNYTSSTIRSANNSASNRLSFIMGLAEDGVSAHAMANLSFGTTPGFGEFGFALDATNVQDKAGFFQGTTTPAVASSAAAVKHYDPMLGWHFIQATEKGDNTNPTTFSGAKYEALSIGLTM